jgi:hypothetical protein
VQISTDKEVSFPCITAAYTCLLNPRAPEAATSSKEDASTKKGVIKNPDNVFFLNSLFSLT